MIRALVAGVPIPLMSFSFIRLGLSGATYFQMFAIAEIKVPSVKRFGGIVFCQKWRNLERLIHPLS